MDDLLLRRAQPDDADLIADLRLAFLREVAAEAGDTERAADRPALVRYFANALTDGSFVCWLAQSERRTVGLAAITIYERPAGAQVMKEGCLMNVYVVPEARDRRAASMLLEAVIAFSAEQGIRLWSLATDAGKPIYERVGFRHDPRFMRWP